MKVQSSKFKVQSFFRVILTLTFFLLTLTTPAYANCIVDPIKGVSIKDCFGFGRVTSFGKITSDLVGPVFSIATALVVIYFLWGAFKFLISGSNKEEVAEARQMITHAIIGFIILIFAFFILQFLLGGLFNITDYQIIK